MKKWKIIVSLIILAVLLSIGGYFVWANSRISGAEIVPLEALESEDYISYDSQYILLLSRDEFWMQDQSYAITDIKYIDNVFTLKENANLVEIKNTYPGLTKRTGVFKKLFSKNKTTNKNLSIEKDNGVFDDKVLFELDKEDFEKVDSFTRKNQRKKTRGLF